MSLVMSSSTSDGLHNLAIFKTSLISLLPDFHTEDAICIIVFWGNLLIILTDIASNSSYVYSGISKGGGLLSRSVLFDVANITTLVFTVFVFLTLVFVKIPRSIIVSRPS